MSFLRGIGEFFSDVRNYFDSTPTAALPPAVQQVTEAALPVISTSTSQTTASAAAAPGPITTLAASSTIQTIVVPRPESYASEDVKKSAFYFGKKAISTAETASSTKPEDVEKKCSICGKIIEFGDEFGELNKSTILQGIYNINAYVLERALSLYTALEKNEDYPTQLVCEVRKYYGIDPDDFVNLFMSTFKIGIKNDPTINVNHLEEGPDLAKLIIDERIKRFKSLIKDHKQKFEDMERLLKSHKTI